MAGYAAYTVDGCDFGGGVDKDGPVVGGGFDGAVVLAHDACHACQGGGVHVGVNEVAGGDGTGVGAVLYHGILMLHPSGYAACIVVVGEQGSGEYAVFDSGGGVEGAGGVGGGAEDAAGPAIICGDGGCGAAVHDDGVAYVLSGYGAGVVVTGDGAGGVEDEVADLCSLAEGAE